MLTRCASELEYHAECDLCSFDDLVEATNLSDAIDELKENGWTLRHEANRIQHVCPSCTHVPF